MKDSEILALKGMGCKAVYVACPVHKQDAAFALRNEVVAGFRGHSHVFTLPFYSDLSEEEREGKNIYEFDMERVRQADIVVVILTTPSTGVGMELREAQIHSIPVRVFASPRSAASGIVHDYLKYRDLPQVISWDPELPSTRAPELIVDEVLRWLEIHPDGHSSVDGSWRHWHYERQERLRLIPA